MNYIEVKLTLNPYNEAIAESIVSELEAIGFESFQMEDPAIFAYIPKADYDESSLQSLLNSLVIKADIEYEWNELEERNWNEEWEKNYFDPVIIDDKCVIKSSFHKNVPDFEYTIVINPKMAFGTGHHQTTILMLKEILKEDFTAQSVLDMGCGTAILSIMASMRNAKKVTAIDIDQWAYDNAIENLSLNNIHNVSVEIGGAELLGKQVFDTIIANINRNILLEDLHHYNSVLKEDGTLYMSGFYIQDIEAISNQAAKYNLRLEYYTEQDNWAGVKFTKRT